MIKRYKIRTEFLRLVELDWKDGKSRADNLVMDLARRYVKDNIHRLMKSADLNSVRKIRAFTLMFDFLYKQYIIIT